MARNHRTAFKKFGHRFAEEKQLLAEEKWILDALKKLRNQINSLQIERLELESIKSTLTKASNLTTEEIVRKHLAEVDDEVPTNSTTDPMKRSTATAGLQANKENIESKPPVIAPQSEYINFDIPVNMEELHLEVPTPVYNILHGSDQDIEEDESDEDNILLDIDMLMNYKDDNK